MTFDNINLLQSLINSIIRGFPIAILFILLYNKIRKEHGIDTPFSIIRYVLIGYGILGVLDFVINYYGTEEVYVNRIHGPYELAYWTMFFSSAVFPLILIYSKIGVKKVLLFFTPLIINVGFYFESFVIIITSLHRDYLPESISSVGMNTYMLFSTFLLYTLLNGFVIAFILIGIAEFYQKAFKENQ